MNMLASTAATLRSSLCRNQRTATAAVGAVRNLNVHEYISMEIMNAHHIPTPRAYVAKTPEEAEAIYTQKLAHRKSSKCPDQSVCVKRDDLAFYILNLYFRSKSYEQGCCNQGSSFVWRTRTWNL